VDGLIVAPTTEDFSYLNHILGRRKIPIVFVDRKPNGYNGDIVMAENEQGVYVAIKYLIEKGHRNIGFVASRFDTTMNERLDGYRRAVMEAGISINENLIKTGDRFTVSLKSLRHGVSFGQTKELIDMGVVTAIFAGNLLASVGAFTCLRELEIKVPQDIAFLTFDDSFWLTMTTPSLSAVAQKPEEIGYVAGDIICKRLSSDSSTLETFKHVRIPTELILRESC
jgi:LacI family transcriptional regulator